MNELLILMALATELIMLEQMHFKEEKKVLKHDAVRLETN